MRRVSRSTLPGAGSENRLFLVTASSGPQPHATAGEAEAPDSRRTLPVRRGTLTYKEVAVHDVTQVQYQHWRITSCIVTAGFFFSLGAEATAGVWVQRCQSSWEAHATTAVG